MSAPHDDEAPVKGFSRPLLRRVLQFARPYRAAFFASIAFLFALAGLGLLLPLIIRHAIDHYLPPPGAPALLPADEAFDGVLRAGGLLLAIGAVIFVCRYLQLRIINQTGQRIIHDLRLAVFRHITTRSLRFFDKNPVGRLVSRAQRTTSSR
jgi:ATP-binding cassette, subfamily B, multidrug efflux pump